MKQSVYDVAVIGGGPGGYAAALYCARAGLSVVVLEKLSPGGQMGTTDQVDNYPGFAEGINGFDLGMRMQQGAERFGVETQISEVLSAELSARIKVFKTTDGEYRAKTAVLATGASPRELGLPEERGLRGRGVSYCATCDGMFYRGKDVVVIGGGDTAAADAVFLSKLCRSVTLIHRRNILRASKAYLAPLSKCTNLHYVWNAQVESILHAQKVTGVVTRDRNTGAVRELACDGVFVAVGQIPNTGLFRGQVSMDEAGYLRADETTRTNLPGVYAVGDLRQKPLRQIVTAVADGAVASKFAEEYLSAGE